MILTTSTLMLLLVAQQPDPRTGRHVAPLRDFVSIRLSADRSVYYRGERVRLRIALMNTADRAVQGYFALAPGLGPTRLLYRRTGTDFSEMHFFQAPPGTLGLRLRTLNAGEELVKDVDVSLVTLEPMTLLLDRVGLYEFLVAFEDVPADANARLESNTVSIQVVEPPASEHEAMAAYTEPLAYLAQVPDGPAAFVPPERMAEAAAFIGRFPRSRYAGPVKEGLLKWLRYRIQTRRATEEETALYDSLR